MKRSETVWFMLVVAVASAGAGLFYSKVLVVGSPPAAMIYGLFIGSCVSALDRGLIAPEMQSRIKRLPTLFYIPVSEAAYIAMVLIGHACAGLIVWWAGLLSDTLMSCVIPSFKVLVYCLIVTALFVFVLRVRDLIGREVFANLLIGRYHRPVEERRIFLFLDLVGSTTYARTHGDLRAQEYLGAIFAAIAEPVRLHAGAIDDYVGDMAMITWPQDRGVEEGRCVGCVFAIIDGFERNAADWRRRFGQVPHMRAALHGGSVVTAEVGIDRHKISYFGDVVNTTARIEGLCRHLDAPVLISADLLALIPALPHDVRSFSRGHHPMKGGDRQLQVFSLEAGSTTPAGQIDRSERGVLAV